ncbi:unnamed protein product [Victoria cruziana]
MGEVVENIRGNESEEQRKLALFRARVNKEDPDAKEHDDLMLRRFLRARDLNIEKSTAMFLKYLKWRREFMPRGFVSESEIPNEIRKEKVFVQGFDKEGRPLAVIMAGRHTSDDRDLEEIKRLTVYAVDMLCARTNDQQEKFALIGDFQGWGYASSDIRAYIAVLEILQDYYPERMGKVYMVHVPYLFWTAWKIVYPFIDDNTKKKITFVENKHIKETLLEDIDEHHLPDVYGGKQPLLPLDRDASLER